MPAVLELCRIEGPARTQGANVADVLLGRVASVKDAALIESGEKGEPVRLAVLRREGQLLEGTSFAWCAFREAWVGKGKALVTADWKLCRYENGAGELYDLKADVDGQSRRPRRPPHAAPANPRPIRRAVEGSGTAAP